jgi:RNA polymerase sigma factor (sigma-70 family)
LAQTAYEGLCRARQTYQADLSGFGFYGGQWAKAYTHREICKMQTTIAVGERVRAKMVDSGENDLLTHMVRLDASLDGNRNGTGTLSQHDVVAAEGDTPEDEAVSSSDAVAVQAAYARLKPRYRLVLRLRIVEEWTLAAVGKRLGISREGARQCCERAKEALRAELLRGT